MPEAATIQQMFADVAPGYDRANRALSMGIDVLWRRRTVRTVGLAPGERGDANGPPGGGGRATLPTADGGGAPSACHITRR